MAGRYARRGRLPEPRLLVGEPGGSPLLGALVRISQSSPGGVLAVPVTPALTVPNRGWPPTQAVRTRLQVPARRSLGS